MKIHVEVGTSITVKKVRRFSKKVVLVCEDLNPREIEVAEGQILDLRLGRIDKGPS